VRCLAAYDASDWPPEAAARTTKDREAMGLVRGRDGTICKYLDPIPEARHRPANEDARGVPCRRHPLAWLRDTPALWDLAEELLDGVLHELGPEDRYLRSNAEWEAIAAFRAAEHRRTMREVQLPRGGAVGHGDAGDGRRRGEDPHPPRQGRRGA
jgi:hypothetical protein